MSVAALNHRIGLLSPSGEQAVTVTSTVVYDVAADAVAARAEMMAIEVRILIDSGLQRSEKFVQEMKILVKSRECD
jgi:hypothetical protein